MSPGHGAEWDEIIEEQNLAGGPMTKGIVPNTEGDKAAGEDAIELDESDVVSPWESVVIEFGRSERGKPKACAPHGMGGQFSA